MQSTTRDAECRQRLACREWSVKACSSDEHVDKWSCCGSTLTKPPSLLPGLPWGSLPAQSPWVPRSSSLRQLWTNIPAVPCHCRPPSFPTAWLASFNDAFQSKAGSELAWAPHCNSWQEVILSASLEAHKNTRSLSFIRAARSPVASSKKTVSSQLCSGSGYFPGWSGMCEAEGASVN